MNLRQPRERKPPKRYSSDGTWADITSTPTTPTSPNPTSPTPPTSLQFSRNSTTSASDQGQESYAVQSPYDVSVPAPSPDPQPAPFTLPYHFTAPSASTPAATSMAESSRQQFNGSMANARAVKESSMKEKECDIMPPPPPPPPTQRASRARASLRGGNYDDEELGLDYRPTKKVERTTKPASKNAPAFGSSIPSGQPAAFPSLESVPSEQDSGSLDLKSIVKDREGKDEEKGRASYHKVYRMWDCQAFPDNMADNEKTWYQEIKMWLAQSSFDKPISFAQLWPSLRQTIIDAIVDGTDAFVTYQNAYHPARVLLHLDQEMLEVVLKSNIEFNELDISQQPRLARWLADWQKMHPGEPFDPETPPPTEVVKAIRYLRQEHLPGCLLGEQQFPLPDIVNLAELDNADNPTTPQLDPIDEVDDETDVEFDLEEHTSISVIAILRIQTKYLARLRNWGSKGLQCAKPKCQKPKPAPPTNSIPADILESPPPLSNQHHLSLDKKNRKNYELFERNMEEMFGGFHPSQVAKKKLSTMKQHSFSGSRHREVGPEGQARLPSGEGAQNAPSRPTHLTPTTQVCASMSPLPPQIPFLSPGQTRESSFQTSNIPPRYNIQGQMFPAAAMPPPAPLPKTSSLPSQLPHQGIYLQSPNANISNGTMPGMPSLPPANQRNKCPPPNTSQYGRGAFDYSAAMLNRGYGILEDSQTLRSLPETSKVPPLFVNSAQFSNVRLPSMLSSPHVNANLAPHQRQSILAAPSSAQAALIQQLNRQQQLGAPHLQEFHAPTNSAQAALMQQYYEQHRFGGDQLLGSSSSNFNYNQNYIQRPTYPTTPSTTQDERSADAALQSHFARLRDAFGSEPLRSSDIPAFTLPSNDTDDRTTMSNMGDLDNFTRTGYSKKRHRDASDAQDITTPQDPKRAKLTGHVNNGWP